MMFRAAQLPKTRMSDFIEERVNTFMQEKANGAEPVCIRVVSSMDKEAEVKPNMKRYYVDTGMMQASFKYRGKALLTFQRINGHDVCFFAVFVQEHGDSPTPNARHTYIAYLDSLQYFEPANLRSDLYHEILLAYEEWAKSLGFTTSQVWSCPPVPGDDYIFNKHPPHQKMPTPKRLQNWYIRMLQVGLKKNIVLEFMHIAKHVTSEKITSLEKLPYFEGDSWPLAIEEAITQLEKEEAKRKLQLERAIKNQAQDKVTSASRRKINNLVSNAPSSTLDFQKKLFGKIIAKMRKKKDVSLVFRLLSQEDSTNMKSIEDPDPLMHCPLFDGRDKFLFWCRENNHEFHTLEAAKSATQALLKELMANNTTRNHACDLCAQFIEFGFHCNTCGDYDLCIDCHTAHRNSEQHAHMMAFLADLNNPHKPLRTFCWERNYQFKAELEQLRLGLASCPGDGSCREERACACQLPRVMKELSDHYLLEACQVGSGCNKCAAHLQIRWATQGGARLVQMLLNGSQRTLAFHLKIIQTLRIRAPFLLMLIEMHARQRMFQEQAQARARANLARQRQPPFNDKQGAPPTKKCKKEA